MTEISALLADVRSAADDELYSVGYLDDVRECPALCAVRVDARRALRALQALAASVARAAAEVAP